MYDQQSLISACANAQSDQSLCLLLEYSMNIKLLTEHHLEFLRLKEDCTGSSDSSCQNAPLLEITCHGSYHFSACRTSVKSKPSPLTIFSFFFCFFFFWGGGVAYTDSAQASLTFETYVMPIYTVYDSLVSRGLVVYFNTHTHTRTYTT